MRKIDKIKHIEKVNLLNEQRRVNENELSDEHEKAFTEASMLNDAIHRYQEFVNTNQAAYEILGYSEEDSQILNAAFKLTRQKELKLKPNLFGGQ
jgi:hypothetical protein|tara:strand:+ start:217 stop:501 length:285 start_codon:yes stop_codon:yes gene_type:complete